MYIRKNRPTDWRDRANRSSHIVAKRDLKGLHKWYTLVTSHSQHFELINIHCHNITRHFRGGSDMDRRMISATFSADSSQTLPHFQFNVIPKLRINYGKNVTLPKQHPIKAYGENWSTPPHIPNPENKMDVRSLSCSGAFNPRGKPSVLIR